MSNLFFILVSLRNTQMHGVFEFNNQYHTEITTNNNGPFPPPSLNVTTAIFIIYTWNPRTTQPSPPPSSIRMKTLQPTCAYVPGNARVRPRGKIRLCERIFLFIFFLWFFFRRRTALPRVLNELCKTETRCYHMRYPSYLNIYRLRKAPRKRQSAALWTLHNNNIRQTLLGFRKNYFK